jgi:hypothetical protein
VKKASPPGLAFTHVKSLWLYKERFLTNPVSLIYNKINGITNNKFCDKRIFDERGFEYGKQKKNRPDGGPDGQFPGEGAKPESTRAAE